MGNHVLLLLSSLTYIYYTLALDNEIHLLVTNRMPFEVASDYCENLDPPRHVVSNLGKLWQSYALRSFVNGSASLTGRSDRDEIDIWIGLTGTNPDYKWDSGEIYSEASIEAGVWAGDAGPNDNGGTCTASKAVKGDPYDFEWYKTDCGSLKMFVCEDLCPNSMKSAPGPCGCDAEDIDTDGDGIYDCFEDFYDISLDKASWVQAEEHCEDDGQHLVTLQSAIAEDQLYRTVIQYFTSLGRQSEAPPAASLSFHIGLTDVDEEGRFVFVNGFPLGNHLNWASNQPDNLGGNTGNPDNCAYVSYAQQFSSAKGQGSNWFDGKCTSSRMYICEDNCREDDNKSFKGFCGCGNPDTDVNSNGVADCYEGAFRVIETSGSYADAQEACNDVGLDLVYVGDHATNAQIAQQVAVDLGSQTASYWIGLTAEVPFYFTWDSLGENKHFFPWDYNSLSWPAESAEETMCVYAKASANGLDTLWYVSSCSESHYAVCGDGCPNDDFKGSPGDCGCGIPDIDSDEDGVADCIDECPDNESKIVEGICGCLNDDEGDADGDGVVDCIDECPSDPSKTKPGYCGCDISDGDSDNDGVVDCEDECPTDPNKVKLGLCGCNKSDQDDRDNDGTPDCVDECPDMPEKQVAGPCGCDGLSDTDTDGDGVADCQDECPDNPDRSVSGTCGCDAADTDTDGDGVLDCEDYCMYDKLKSEPGVCGCDTADIDFDHDGVMDCIDSCPEDHQKVEEGQCGCGRGEMDFDGDGVADCIDECDLDPGKFEEGICGCSSPDVDTDGDGKLDCQEICHLDPEKNMPMECGCGISDVDTDSDGTLDCVDECPLDPKKTAPQACGCGELDEDCDEDGIIDCLECSGEGVMYECARFYECKCLMLPDAPTAFANFVATRGPPPLGILPPTAVPGTGGVGRKLRHYVPQLEEKCLCVYNPELDPTS